MLMRNRIRGLLAVGLVATVGYAPLAIAQGMANLGMVGVKSVHGRYLQAHTDGEMHASNGSRNEEETWFLIQVDAQKHLYALYNWRTGNFMSKNIGSNCAPAVSTTLSATEEWILVPGKNYGVVNAVAFRSLADNTFLGANPPGNDTNCGGEVAAGSPAPPQQNGRWPGWWVMEPATAPTAGNDAWNGIGRVFQSIANKINPADVAALIALL